MGSHGVLSRHGRPGASSPPRQHPALEALEPRLLLNGSIEGTLWHDLNANGLRDAGDAGLNGWTVELVEPTTGAVVATQTTAEVDLDDNGTIDPETEVGVYRFTGLDAGDYVVRQVAQVSWAQSTRQNPGPGQAGPQVQVNTYEHDDQYSASIAMNDSGDYVVVWQSRYQDVGPGETRDAGIYGQAYNADGTPRGGEFHVNTYTPATQREPSVAMDEAGRFIVAWECYARDNVYARRYNADGTPQGDEFRVSAPDDASSPAVAMAGSGQAIIVWTGSGLDGYRGVHVRIYDADGTPTGDPFQATSYSGPFAPSVAVAETGDFVVTWTKSRQDVGRPGIFAQRFHADGTPVGSEFTVHDYEPGEQEYSSVAMSPAGNFVVTWEGTSLVDSVATGGVHGRLYDVDGLPLGGSFPVSDGYVTNTSLEAVVMDDVGNFITVWGGHWTIRARMWNADGTPNGNTVVVSPGYPDSASSATVAMNGSGRMVVVFTASSPPGDSDVYVRAYEGFSDDYVHEVALAVDAAVLGADFGSYQPATVSGQKFEDLDVDGLHGAGEPGLDGWEIKLVEGDTGRVIGTQVTAGRDLNGNGTIDPLTERGLYSFEGILPGNYEVREVVREGWAQTMPEGSYPLSLLSGSDAAERDFGNVRTGSVAGQKFEDTDGDGIRDAGEAGLDGWTIELVDPASGSVLATQVTTSIDLDGDGAIDPISETGLYLFDGLLPGNYGVREVGQAGWRQTIPAAGGVHAIVLGYAENLSGVDFGNEPLSGEIIGRKFHDVNGNGTWDLGEAGLNGWTIDLVDPDTGAVLDMQITADVDLDGDDAIDPNTETGVYRFVGVLAGSYIVREVPQPGWEHVPYTTGSGLGEAELLVNTHTGASQYWPSVATDANGNSVIVWHTHDNEAGDYGVRARLFSPDWTPNGGEIVVSDAPTKGHTRTTSVAMNDSGRFVVVWHGSGQPGSEVGIYARMYNADGTPDGEALYVNVLAPFSGEPPSVAINNTGEFVVVWGSRGVGPTYGVHARKYAADGTPAGNEFRVDQTPTSPGSDSSVVMDETGAFTIAWRAGSSYGDIFIRRYNADLTPATDQYRITPDDNRGQALPDIAMNALGRTVVTWFGKSSAVGDNEGVFARILDADGLPVSDEFQVNTYTAGDQRNPAVAINEAGRFVISWHSWVQGGNGYELFAQAFAPNGMPDGGEFQVNAWTTDGQRYGDVAIDGDGRFVFAWQSEFQDGSWEGVYARRFGGFSDDDYVVVDLAEGQTLPGVNFGSFSLASVSGQVFEDLNINGAKDPGEPGLDGWQIELFDPASGLLLGSMVTASVDANGDGTINPETEAGVYLFDPLPSGDYGIRRLSQDDWLDTAPASGEHTVALASGQQLTGKDFGNAQTSSIGGQVFEDFNGDGVRDADEPGLDGWTAKLIDPATSAVLASIVTTSEDLNGDGWIDPITETGLYAFSDLPAGEYELAEVGQTGWVRTLPADEAHTVSLGYNEDLAGWNFGNQAILSEIHGQKFHDLNGNGAHDPNEPGLNGWTIELIDPATGSILATQTTADVDLDGDGTIDPPTESGLYSFVGLARGRYEVREVREAAWPQTYPAHEGPGIIAPEVRVNTYEQSGQGDPEIAVNSAGDFVIVWESCDQDGGDWGVYGQRYHANGTLNGGEFQVNTTTWSAQESPSVAIDESGRFAVVWQSANHDGKNDDIYLQMYHADGTPSGNETQVNQYTDGYQGAQTIAMDASGNFIVVWGTYVNDDSIDGIYARMYYADGTPHGDEFRVSPGIVGSESFPAVAMDGHGNFVVAWSTYDFNADRSDVHARWFKADGTPDGDHFRVNTEPSGGNDSIHAALTDSGRLLVVWGTDHRDGYWSGVYAREFHAAGVPAGDDFLVNTYTDGYEEHSSLAMDPSGRFAVAWESRYRKDQGNEGIYVQLYDADGTPNGPETRISTTTNTYQDTSIALVKGGRLVAAWVGQDDDDNGVYASWVTGFSDDWIHQITLSAGGTAEGADFGNCWPVSISGQKFEDLDRNAYREAGEVGLDGWTIELVDADSGQPVASQVTASIDLNGDGTIDPETESGLYAFTDILPGNYELREVAPGGWAPTVPTWGRYLLTAVSGEQLTEWNFGNFKTSTIGGQKFEDLDGDGTRGADEPGLNGWTIELVDAASGEVSASTVTAGIDLDEDGQIDPISEAGLYAFDGLTAGNYEVRELLQTGWVQTLPAEAVYAISLGYDEHLIDKDFANQAVLGQIHGQEFLDLNANGLRDAGEVGLDGWTVELRDPLTHAVLASTITASIDVSGDGAIDPETESGLYAFTGLDYDRHYEVRQIGRDGWVQFAPDDPLLAVVGPEFQVNTYTEGQQERCEVASNNSGQAVVVWSSHGQNGDEWDIYAQLYNADGTPDGSEFQVNTNTSQSQERPVAAMDEAGGFVIAWVDSETGNSGVFARMYGPDGMPRDAEFYVGPRLPIGGDVAIAMQDTGQFVLAWSSNDSDDSGVFARRYTADGTPVGELLQVNTWTYDDQENPAVAMSNSGQFVIAWQSSDQEYSHHAWAGIYAQMYDADGTPNGGELHVNTTEYRWQRSPSVAMDDSGRFVVLWGTEVKDPATGEFVAASRGQAFGADGTPIGVEFAVEAQADRAERARISMTGAGDFVAAWYSRSETHYDDVFAQAYGADGMPLGEVFGVNSFIDGWQDWPAIAVDDTGNVLVAWQGNRQDGNSSGVFAAKCAVLRRPPVHLVRLAPGQSAESVDFGNYLSGTIGGQVYDDLDGDGARGAGESGLDGWTIELVDPDSEQVVDSAVTSSIDLNNDGVIDPQIEAGLYQIAGFLPGTYEVRQVWRRGWAPTDPITGSHSVDLDAGAAVVLLFGNHALPGDIQGQKFFDTNGNGLADDGEMGLDGWAIELVDPATGAVLAGTVTAGYDLNGDGVINAEFESGLYAFSGLVDETEYEVREVTRPGWVQTAPDSQDHFQAGTEFQVNTYTAGNQREADIAMNATGEFVIAWSSADQDGDSNGVYAQRYHADGTPNGGEFQANTTVAGNQTDPVVAVSDTGQFVIAWTSDPQDGGDIGLFARLYGPDGVANGDEFQVNSAVIGPISDVKAVMGADGSFAIAWSGDGPLIHAQRYFANGTPNEGEFLLDSYEGNRELEPLVAVDASGNFARVRTNRHQPHYDDIYVQMYFADGTPNGDEFLVNSYTRYDQWRPTIAMAPNGRFVVMWRSWQRTDSDKSDIYGQRYIADGTRDGGEFLVNAYTDDYQSVPDVAMDAAGNFVVAWHGVGQDDSDDGVFARRFESKQVHRITFRAGQAVQGLGFGNYRRGTISGQKFEDINGDASPDAGEPGLDGWTVKLVDPATGSVVATTVTASRDLNGDGTIDPETEAGLYTFKHVMPGRYVVREMDQAGWSQTVPASGDYLVSLTDTDITGIDFGNFPNAAPQADDFIDYALNALAFTGQLTASDADAQTLTFAIADGSAHGTLTAFDAQTGEFTYVPDADQVGWHTFTFVANDGYEDSPPATVSLLFTATWQGTDIGSVSHAGSVTQDDATFTVEGSGGDIWGGNDRFYYAYRTLSGDGEVVARVASVENTNDWAKAGVMIRNTLDKASAHAMVVVTPSKGVSFQRRRVAGSGSYHTTNGGYSAPYWVRLVRQGDTLTGYRSVDGQTWTQINSDTIVMGQDVYVGLAVTAHNNSKLCTAEFDNIGIVGQTWGDAGVTGQVFFDANGDGVRDAGEVGLDGREVELVYASTGMPVASRISASLYINDDDAIDPMTEMGRYAFAALMPGRYEVRLAARDGFIQSAPEGPYLLTLADGQVATGIDFGAVQGASVSGQVFEDANGDGLRDAGEEGMDGWTVELVDAATDSIEASFVTASVDLDGDGSISPESESGLYRFEELLPGQYIVRQVARSGWGTSVPASGSHELTLVQGDLVENVDFGNARGGAVDGTKFEDLNGDGLFDEDEQGLDGWTIELVNADSGDVVAFTVTAGVDMNGDGQIDPSSESGLYSFDGVMPGNYELREVSQAGWVRTAPASTVYSFTLGFGDMLTARDFGNQIAPSEIRGRKFHDLNGNGVQDADEVGLDGWTIQLVDPATDSVMASAVTASIDLNEDSQIDPETESGLYAFEALSGGDYRLGEQQQPGWTCSGPPLAQYDVSLTPGQVRSDLHFGNYLDNSIRGRAWEDLNFNGQSDPAEGGLDGWTVELVDAATGSVVAIKTTASIDLDDSGTIEPGTESGVYRFFGLAPGRYEVRTVTPAGWTNVAPPGGIHMLTLASGDAVTDVDFGKAQGGMIAGRKFGDLDGNGLFDEDEPGLDGWTIELVDADSGEVVTSQVTSSVDLDGDGTIDPKTESGLYSLSGIAPGAYELREVRQAAWVQTAPASNVYLLMLGYNEDLIDLNFGNRALSGRIGGRKFHDRNGNGLHDDNEEGLDGWTVELIDPATGSVIASAVTVSIDLNEDSQVDPSTESGLYAFSGLGPGDYELREVAQGGWVQTAPVSGVYSLALGYGHVLTDKDFGNQALPGEIRGRKFHDLNGNGSQDADEVGLDGWTIELVDPATGSVIASAITTGIDLNGDSQIDPATESGLYAFEGLSHGDYLLREVSRPGWDSSDPLVSPPAQLGPGFRVSTWPGGAQEKPATAMADDGSFIVAWTSMDQDGDNGGIYAQRFGPDGTPEGGEFKVNTWAVGRQAAVAAAMNAAGQFVVAWESYGQDGDNYAVCARVYYADGTANGNPLQVNEHTADSQGLVSVAMDNAGGFILVWQSVDQDGDGSGIYAQQFNVAGRRAGAEFRVNTHTSANQDAPFVAINGGGRAVVVWESYSQDDDGDGIFARTYGPDGRALTDEILVNTHTTNNQNDPAVAICDSGEFVVVWHSRGQDGSGAGVYGQRFHDDGTPNGAEFRVNSRTSGNQQRPSVALAESGRFVVAWESWGQDGSSAGIYAQSYHADGTPGGLEMSINQYTDVSQQAPSVATDGGGRFIITWDGPDQAQSGQVIAARQLTIAPAHNIALKPGQTAPADFAGYRYARISGAVWQDTDGDGGWGPDEQALSGLVIFFDSDGDGLAGDGEVRTQTDANGDFAFALLGPGDYAVRGVFPNNWQETTPARDLVLLSGQSAVAVNLGARPLQSPAAAAPDLLPWRDTGIAANDNITWLDNSEPLKAFQFTVGGTVAGAMVTVYAGSVPMGSSVAADGETVVATDGAFDLTDDMAIGSVMATGTTTIVATNGSYDLVDDEHSITARQTEPGKLESADSLALTITIDTVAPTLDTWSSAATHGALGELLLEIPDDGAFTEPRSGGIRMLVLEFSEEVDLSGASVVVAGNNDDGGPPMDLSDITVALSSRDPIPPDFVFSDTAEISFSSAVPDVGLPDVARYLVQLDGVVVDRAGNALTDDHDRIMTSLIGDMKGDHYVVDVRDLYWAWAYKNQGADVGPSQTRADMDLKGVIDVRDLYRTWGKKNHRASFNDPVLSKGLVAGGGSFAAAAAPWSPAPAAAVLPQPGAAQSAANPLDALDVTVRRTYPSDNATGLADPVPSSMETLGSLATVPLITGRQRPSPMRGDSSVRTTELEPALDTDLADILSEQLDPVFARE